MKKIIISVLFISSTFFAADPDDSSNNISLSMKEKEQKPQGVSNSDNESSGDSL